MYKTRVWLLGFPNICVIDIYLYKLILAIDTFNKQWLEFRDWWSTITTFKFILKIGLNTYTTHTQDTIMHPNTLTHKITAQKSINSILMENNDYYGVLLFLYGTHFVHVTCKNKFPKKKVKIRKIYVKKLSQIFINFNTERGNKKKTLHFRRQFKEHALFHLHLASV